jgi:hypothetical protein
MRRLPGCCRESILMNSSRILINDGEPCPCIIFVPDSMTGFKMPGAAYDLGCETRDHTSRNSTGYRCTRQASSHQSCLTLCFELIYNVHSLRSAKFSLSLGKILKPIQLEGPEQDHVPASWYKTGELSSSEYLYDSEK